LSIYKKFINFCQILYIHKLAIPDYKIEKELKKMNASKKNIDTKLYEYGQAIGLNKNEINCIIDNIIPNNEQLTYVAGPQPYLSSFYGTFSILDI
jgi:hypothetical protein